MPKMYDLQPGQKYNQSYLDWMNTGEPPWTNEIASGPEVDISGGASSGSGGSGGGYGGGRPLAAPSYPTMPSIPDFQMPTYSVPEYAGSGMAIPRYNAPDVGEAPKYKADFRELPTYTAPAWNQAEIDSLAQTRAAPGIRALRQQVQRVTGRRYDNPQVGRMTLREALQGYGTGLSNVLGQASQAAAGEYGQKYARTSENSRAAYASEAAKVNAYNQFTEDVATKNYQGSFAEWQAENQGSLEKAKMDYMGSMKEFDTAEDRARLKYGTEADISKTKYLSDIEDRRDERRLRADLGKTKYLSEYGVASDTARANKAYEIRRKELEDEWEMFMRKRKIGG